MKEDDGLQQYIKDDKSQNNTEKADDENGDEDKGKIENGDNENSDEVSERNKYSRRKKESNAWKYEDPVIDETILKDPEFQAELERVRNEELETMKDLRNKVINNVKTKNGDVLTDYKPVQLGKKSKQQKREESENWKYISSGEEDSDEDEDDNETNDSKPQIRYLTKDEEKEFYKLEGEVNHQKKIQSMKDQMIKINGRKPTNKVLEVKTKSDREGYKNLIDKKLSNMKSSDNSNKEDSQNVDVLVKEIYGIDLTKDDDTATQTPHSKDIFNVDTVVSNTSANQQKQTVGTKRPTVNIDLSDDDEDFLNSLL